MNNLGGLDTLSKRDDGPVRILVVGAPAAGKLTLVASLLKSVGVAAQSEKIRPQEKTYNFGEHGSTITIVRDLCYSSKNRASSWKQIATMVAEQNVDVVWFCVAGGHLHGEDWHWIRHLHYFAVVVVVRLQSVEADTVLIEKVQQQHMLIPVVCLLIEGMKSEQNFQVKPYGSGQLISVTQELLEQGGQVHTGVRELMEQMEKDVKRYEREDEERDEQNRAWNKNNIIIGVAAVVAFTLVYIQTKR